VHMCGESGCSQSMIGCQLIVVNSMSDHVRTWKPPGRVIDAREPHAGIAKHIRCSLPYFPVCMHDKLDLYSHLLAISR
jgi:hypothetical protein